MLKIECYNDKKIGQQIAQPQGGRLCSLLGGLHGRSEAAGGGPGAVSSTKYIHRIIAPL